jgi:uncharacterized protein (TIGR04255 family)
MKYANAPLKYVAFAADLSPASVLGEMSALDRIHEALRGVLPVREDQKNALIPTLEGLVTTSGARFVDASRHRAVLVTPVRIAVDTTRYSTFNEFSGFLEEVIGAVSEVAPGRACRRLGLRYVDEIRVPGTEPGNVGQWSEWVDAALLPAAALRPTAGRRELSGAIDDTFADGFGVRFAWHTGTGHAVNPSGPLLVPDPSEPGPYFALDTDSYWSATPGTEILGLGDAALVQRIQRLHEPVQEFFETSLTDRLRNEVLRPLEST